MRVFQGGRRGLLPVDGAAGGSDRELSRGGRDGKGQRPRHRKGDTTSPHPSVAAAFASSRRVPGALHRAGVGACLLALACLALAGCRGETDAAPGIRVAHEVSPSPPAVGPSSILLTLADESGRPVAGAAVEVEGNMSHPGMVPELASAVEVEPGRYRAEMEFTMAGDWILSVRATLPDGRTVRREVDVRGVKAG